MGEKGEGGSKGGGVGTGFWGGAESPIRVYLVPDKQRASERVALQNQKNGHRRMQVRKDDDRGTCSGRLPRTGAVEAA